MSFSATDNIWPEAARGHLARGRMFGQRPCGRPRTVSFKARGPTKESKQRQGPSLIVIKFVWDYWRLQLIVIRFVSRVMGVDHCCWRGAQAQSDHLVEEPFVHMSWVQSDASIVVSSQPRVMLRHWVFKHGAQICPHSYHPDGSVYLYHRALVLPTRCVGLIVRSHAPQECGASVSTCIAAAT